MNRTGPPPDMDTIPEAEVTEAGSRFVLVWLLPLVALVVAGWLLYKTFADKGPTIVIRFKTAAGIEAKKTPIKYRGVSVGRVSTVTYTPDLASVIVEAQMKRGADSYLNENSRFWVVRPRIGAAGISGLNTLVSGAYIELDPGKGGAPALEFEGLEQPPGITSDRKGSIYHLRADKLGSLSVGSPVYFRQIPVGEVVDYGLTKDHRHVDISIFIESPHNEFVHTNTRFWNVAGLEVTLSTSGLTVDMESLTALLSGGVAFETPASLSTPQKASEDHLFTLFDNHKQTEEQQPQAAVTYVLYFDDTVRGLTVGAPVEFRGIRIGSVKDFGLVAERSGQLRIPVLVDIEVDRFLPSTEKPALSPQTRKNARKQLVEALVKRGLRARLQTANYLTGQVLVDLDFFPDAEPRKVGYEGRFPELPTMPRPFVGIMTGITDLLAKLERLPLDEIGRNLKETAAGANRIVNGPAVEQTVNDLRQSSADLRHLLSTLDDRAGDIMNSTQNMLKKTSKALDNATKTFDAFSGVVDKDTPLGNQLYQALEQIAEAARAVRGMADYLERHPESLLQGKR